MIKAGNFIGVAYFRESLGHAESMRMHGMCWWVKGLWEIQYQVSQVWREFLSVLKRWISWLICIEVVLNVSVMMGMPRERTW